MRPRPALTNPGELVAPERVLYWRLSQRFRTKGIKSHGPNRAFPSEEFRRTALIFATRRRTEQAAADTDRFWKRPWRGEFDQLVREALRRGWSGIRPTRQRASSWRGAERDPGSAWTSRSSLAGATGSRTDWGRRARRRDARPDVRRPQARRVQAGERAERASASSGRSALGLYMGMAPESADRDARVRPDRRAARRAVFGGLLLGVTPQAPRASVDAQGARRAGRGWREGGRVPLKANAEAGAAPGVPSLEERVVVARRRTREVRLAWDIFSA